MLYRLYKEQNGDIFIHFLIRVIAVVAVDASKILLGGQKEQSQSCNLRIDESIGFYFNLLRPFAGIMEFCHLHAM